MISTKVINGTKISKQIQYKISKLVKKKIAQGYRAPGLAVILIGNNPSSELYVLKKKIACKTVGFISRCWRFPNTISEHTIISLIKHLNLNHMIDGILVQLPLPKHMNTIKIINSIVPHKDIDGFHPYNIGSLCQKNPLIRSCTPRGIMTMLKYYKIKTHGLNAVIIGASYIVGRPMFLELLLAGCTTTVTHQYTKNLSYHTQNADLLISAVGKACFIKENWIKQGAIIIDAGINILNTGEVVGDIEYSTCYEKASLITPVPGGVGPMTVTSLLQNTFESYSKNIQFKKIKKVQY